MNAQVVHSPGPCLITGDDQPDLQHTRTSEGRSEPDDTAARRPSCPRSRELFGRQLGHTAPSNPSDQIVVVEAQSTQAAGGAEGLPQHTADGVTRFHQA